LHKDPPIPAAAEYAFQTSISPECGNTYSVDEALVCCPVSRDLLDVQYEWDKLPVPASLREFEARWGNRRDPLDFSGVWRFRELLPFAPPEQMVTIGEGQTILQQSDRVGRYVGAIIVCICSMRG
jgi:threonine synthase